MWNAHSTPTHPRGSAGSTKDVCMDIERSVDSLLKSLFPAREERPPVLLTLFDASGNELYRRYLGDISDSEPSPEPSSTPDPFTFSHTSEERSRADDEDEEEKTGLTLDGHRWIRVSVPLPNKRRGYVVVVALGDMPGGLHGLLARVVRQHFSSLRTLEETRIKARFDERIIRSMSSGFIVLLPDTTIMHVNPEGERILGYRQGELIGRRLDTVLTSRLRVLEVFRTGKPIIDEEMVIRVGNRPVRIIKTAVAVFDDDGKVVAVMDLFKEIKEVHRLVTRMAGSQVRYTFDDIIHHKDSVMAEAIEMGRTAATSSLSVLITGESGTGKELFAQAIHAASARRNAPFVVIDCASMPRDLVESELFGYVEGTFTGALKGGRPGKFELADGGTVFLDELGELPLELQSRLLRVLQSRQVMRLGSSQPVPVDIRVIAATNRDLLEQIRTKSFRDDLYYRLNVLSIRIPPLRSRPRDILMLAEHFLLKYQRTMSREGLLFTPEAIRMLLSSPWPGNVRELENTVARAVQICGTEIRPEDLVPGRDPAPFCFIPNASVPDAPRRKPALQPTETERPDAPAMTLSGPPSALPRPTKTPSGQDGPAQLRALQGEFYISALYDHGGNIAETARFLGVARSTIYKKLRALGLDATQICNNLRENRNRRSAPESAAVSPAESPAPPSSPEEPEWNGD